MRKAFAFGNFFFTAIGIASTCDRHCGAKKISAMYQP
jgi:hypothetical protein